MSDYQQRDLSGNLFRNDKGGNEARPDYRGEANIGGTIYTISSWLKDGQKGKYMSLSFQPKESRPQQAARPSQSQRPMHGTKTDSGFDDLDSDPIPF